ncbi:hypothetical protein E2562_020082 [Oryza meyeriana var. granulata]|uniref:Uncharacterized protein n=1 Tax=Oryza meyeriana var. granulata TaxID=110450 RepID=A0A6G1EAM3_9ORYZ|nr:hypothetical protein E2562_020082 [Oryza meyeriana var. granulata]
MAASSTVHGSCSRGDDVVVDASTAARGRRRRGYQLRRGVVVGRRGLAARRWRRRQLLAEARTEEGGELAPVGLDDSGLQLGVMAFLGLLVAARRLHLDDHVFRLPDDDGDGTGRSKAGEVARRSEHVELAGAAVLPAPVHYTIELMRIQDGPRRAVGQWIYLN